MLLAAKVRAKYNKKGYVSKTYFLNKSLLHLWPDLAALFDLKQELADD